MATISEVIYNIKNLKEGGLHSDDTELSDEQVIFIVNYYRARLLKQEYQKNKSILEGAEQILQEVKIVEPSSLNSNKKTFGTLDKNTKVTESIPKAINISGGLAFKSVGKGENSFTYIKEGRAPFIKYARFTSCAGYFFNLGNRLGIITEDKNVKKIPIVGIFEDPIAVIEFNEGKTLVDYNIEYPLPEYLLDTIYKLMIESEYAFSLAIPDRNTNDTKDDQETI